MPSFIYIYIYNFFYLFLVCIPLFWIDGISEYRAFATVIYCTISQLTRVFFFHFFWYHVVILFGLLFKIWKEFHLVQQGWVHMDIQNVMMILIALSAWSYCMNLSQPLVDILFADRVYFSQWIVVSAIFFWLYFLQESSYFVLCWFLSSCVRKQMPIV